jgi:hypothetical protein
MLHKVFSLSTGADGWLIGGFTCVLEGALLPFLAEGDFFWDNKKRLFSLWHMFEIGLRTDRSREVHGGVNKRLCISSVYSAVRMLDISTV